MSEPVRDEAWVRDTFGDVGPEPSNEVIVDPDAEPAPNIERPCGDGVDDDG
jgi:hypothetical protein